ncbi:component of SufBCD complex [Aliiroseovarius marinus]|uniref:component of SufBCD complex n=1 Tax=Aliiroseovarius marinus TaxID=2500159 RepID=UPI003D7F0EF7
MDIYSTLLEVIDMRSFSNLWYWIALAVAWSTVSHWVIGVPYDMLQKAGRRGGQAEIDFEDMVRINCNRLLYIAGVSGLWMLGIVSAVLTTLGLLGFWYGVEFAQAVFLLLFPMSIVGLMSLNTAAVVRDRGLEGEALRKRLSRHRIQTQFLGMLAIFITSLWGMFQNLSHGVLLR